MDMSEISVRVLDGSEWSVYRDVRLRALAESPGFVYRDLGRGS